MKSIGIGISDFKELIEGNYYFVDKSLLIRDVIKDGGKVLLLPRPRRFGKTLNMSMLKNFFDIRENTKHLFKRISNRTRNRNNGKNKHIPSNIYNISRYKMYYL